MYRDSAIVFGASGALGRALVNKLERCGSYARIHAGGRHAPAGFGAGVAPFAFDLLDDASIAAALARVEGPIGLTIVATGLLHDEQHGVRPERSAKEIDQDAMARVFAVNAIGPALIARHVLTRMPRDRRAVFAALSARVGSVSDNRLGGWHSYRASKAALNMLIANFAIELRRSHPLAVVAGLHPGTVDSALSSPFQRNVPSGQLLAPETGASRLLAVLDSLTAAQSGQCFAHDGTVILP